MGLRDRTTARARLAETQGISRSSCRDGALTEVIKAWSSMSSSVAVKRAAERAMIAGAKNMLRGEGLEGEGRGAR